MIKKGKRKNPTHRQKARLLQEVDNSCPFCNFNDAGRLEFHHIDENPANTVLTNLIAICPNCHSSINENVITQANVVAKKKELESKFRKKKRAVKAAANIDISNSTLNNSVIGNDNNVTINITKKETKNVNKYPDGSIGQDVIMYNYISYLIKRYDEYKEIEFKRTRQKYHYGVLKKNIMSKFKTGAVYHIPQTRFLELVNYLQGRINRTIIGKTNKFKGHKNYTSLEDYKIKNS